MPTAPTMRCARWCAKPAKSSALSAAMGATPANFTGCTISPSTARETSTQPRSTPESARRNSATSDRPCARSRLLRRRCLQPARLGAFDCLADIPPQALKIVWLLQHDHALAYGVLSAGAVAGCQQHREGGNPFDDLAREIEPVHATRHQDVGTH